MYSKGHGGNIYNEAVKYDFSVNTNPLGMPEDVKEKLKENLGNICQVYPEETCYELRKSISLKENISEHQIMCGNGASELIYGLVRAIRPRKALVVVPSFSEYIRALRANDSEIVYYQLAPERDFIVAEDIMSYLTPELDMVFLCNPNNPTGKLIEPDLMLDIITYCRMNRIYVVIDECFMDFVKDYEKHTRKGLIPYNPYVVISDVDLIHAVNVQLPSWNVSAVAQLAGKEVVHHEDYVEESRKYVFREREYMYEEMKKMGFKVYEPSANFIFFQSDIPLYQELLDRHILIRNCDNFDGIMHGYCRVAIKKHDENEILLKEMKDIIQNDSETLKYPAVIS